ncbi:MAG: TonB-dependent receptor [Bryobacteraceae bacterium]
MKTQLSRAIWPFIIFLFAGSLTGQEVRSTILGRVLDPHSNAVVGTAVTVTNTGTNVAVTLQTNETGYYEAKFLLPGTYEVKAKAPGFKELTRTGIVLSLGRRAQVDLQLELGAVAESIEVTGEAPLVETSGVSGGRVLDNRILRDLPVFYNNTMDLMRFAPGSFYSGVNATSNALHASGGAVDATNAAGAGNNSWSLDGAPNLARGGVANTPAFVPHVDIVQEVKIETYNFDASVGFSTGLNVTMLTKTGTNELHGSASNQHWQQRWNGTPFFTKKLYYNKINSALAAGNQALADELRAQDKQPSGHSNNYAATVGGPVILPKIYNGKDRFFFFFSYNGIKMRSSATPSQLNQTIPTMAEREGDFSKLLNINSSTYQIYDPLTIQPDSSRSGHYIRQPFQGNIIPKSRIINPVYPWYLKLLPTPNNDPVSSSQEALNNYVAVGMKTTWDLRTYNNRYDYQLSEKHHFFGRWTYFDWTGGAVDWTYETLPGFANSFQYWKQVGGTVDWVYTINSQTLFNLSVSDTRYGTGNNPAPAARVKPSEVGLPSYLDTQAGDLYYAPTMSVSGVSTQTGSLGPMQQGYPIRTYYTLPSAKANLSLIRGRHSVNAGFETRLYLRNSTQGGNTTGNFTFNNTYVRRNDDSFTPTGTQGFGWAAFMLGLPSGSTLAINSSIASRNWAYGWFVQDTFRVTPKLTLNYGLRVEYERGVTERYDRMIGGFDPTLQLPISSGAATAYAANPISELAASAFTVRGGSVYPGVNGASRELWPSTVMWEPRFGVAYQLNSKTVLRGGYGVFYDQLNSWSTAPNQLGFSRTTSTTITNDYGMTWLVGNPSTGISPLTDPFPVRSDGTRFDMPLGDALGAMAVAGSGFTVYNPNGDHTREQRYSIGIQRQLDANTMLGVYYVGNYATNVFVGGGFNNSISVSRNLNPLPEKYWATGMVRNDAIASNLSSNVTNPFYIGNFASLQTSNPVVYRAMSAMGFFTSKTITKAQLLRPFPQMSSLTQGLSPDGLVRTDELDINLQRQFAKGFTVNATFTRLRNRTADYYNNEFDAYPSWREGFIGRPYRFYANALVELPFGKGRRFLQSGIPSAIFGGFQVGVSYELQPGPLISWPGNIFYYGNDLKQIGSQPHTYDRWFNTAGFERSQSKGPASYAQRSFPTQVPGSRADWNNAWNANVQREFQLAERAFFELRAEAINLQNRSLMASPNTNPYSTQFGMVTSQTNTYNRFIQLQARIRF